MIHLNMSGLINVRSLEKKLNMLSKINENLKNKFMYYALT